MVGTTRIEEAGREDKALQRQAAHTETSGRSGLLCVGCVIVEIAPRVGMSSWMGRP